MNIKGILNILSSAARIFFKTDSTEIHGSSFKAAPIETNPIRSLQSKCGVPVDGLWGPATFRAARDHFKLTNNRAVHFFAQCSHETMGFKVFSENLNYSEQGLLKTFRKYFPNLTIAKQYARKPQSIANRVYANRMGNGAEDSGDGWKYRGRGVLQLTGKQNYQAFSNDIDRPDVMKDPDIVAGELAFESALYFFRKNRLWDICDNGFGDITVKALTKRINGGYNGLDDRLAKTRLYSKWI